MQRIQAPNQDAPADSNKNEVLQWSHAEFRSKSFWRWFCSPGILSKWLPPQNLWCLPWRVVKYTINLEGGGRTVGMSWGCVFEAGAVGERHKGENMGWNWRGGFVVSVTSGALQLLSTKDLVVLHQICRCFDCQLHVGLCLALLHCPISTPPPMFYPMFVCLFVCFLNMGFSCLCSCMIMREHTEDLF